MPAKPAVLLPRHVNLGQGGRLVPLRFYHLPYLIAIGADRDPRTIVRWTYHSLMEAREGRRIAYAMRQGRRFLGCYSVRLYPEDPLAETDYLLKWHPDAARLAERAAQLVCSVLFEGWGYGRFDITCNPNSPFDEELAHNLGMQYELIKRNGFRNFYGFWDAPLYSITRKNWSKLAAS